MFGMASIPTYDPNKAQREYQQMLEDEERARKEIGLEPYRPMSEEARMAVEAGRINWNQRRDLGHGGINQERDDSDNRVSDAKPFRNLKG